MREWVAYVCSKEGKQEDVHRTCVEDNESKDRLQAVQGDTVKVPHRNLQIRGKRLLFELSPKPKSP